MRRHRPLAATGYAGGAAPVLLTQRDRLVQVTGYHLRTEMEPTQLVILGGAAAITEETELELTRTMAPFEVDDL